MSRFCTVHDKMYVYTDMPSAFYAKKESLLISLWRSMRVLVLIRALHQFLVYQRCSQLVCVYQRRLSSIINHASQVKQKAPIQHRGFLKTKRNEIHRSGKVKRKKTKSKLPYLVRPLCHLDNYNLGIYMGEGKENPVCMLLPLTHTHLADQIIQNKAGGWVLGLS